MNDLIKEQLSKCRWATIPEFDDSTTYMVIYKNPKPVQEFKINSFYIIEIADYVLKPSSNFTLADNWNKGIIPQSKYIRCQVTQIMGKMIKIGGIGYDINTREDKSDIYPELWLPSSSITIIECLEE